MATSVIPKENAVEITNATGAAVNVKYVRSGNVVICFANGNAKIGMEAGQSYSVNADMYWKPKFYMGWESFCRNGTAAYFELSPTDTPNFTIVPRSNIAQNSTMAFCFTYITEG